MDRQRRDFPLEVRAAREDGTFTGILSAYGVKDEYGDIVEPGAFDASLKQNGGSVPLLWQHRIDEPIGALALRDTEKALLVDGKLLLSVPRAKEAYDFLKAGVVRGLSVGFRTIRDEIREGVRRLLEVKLYEGSLVTIPANPKAVVTDVKTVASVRDFEAFLRQCGLSKSEAVRVASHGYKGLGLPDEPEPDPAEGELLVWLQERNAAFRQRR